MPLEVLLKENLRMQYISASKESEDATKDDADKLFYFCLGRDD